MFWFGTVPIGCVKNKTHETSTFKRMISGVVHSLPRPAWVQLDYVLQTLISDLYRTISTHLLTGVSNLESHSEGVMTGVIRAEHCPPLSLWYRNLMRSPRPIAALSDEFPPQK